MTQTMVTEKNPNKNCLEGMACPNCGSFGPFKIMTQIEVLVSDEGTEDEGGDYEWITDARCRCNGCEHTGTVGSFSAGHNCEAR